MCSNFPYPSSYMFMGGSTVLPAYPMRVACSHLDFNTTQVVSAEEHLDALSASISVFYNASKTKSCYDFNPPNDERSTDVNFWEYLYCTEMCQPFESNGVTDMFWPQVQNWTDTAISCKSTWGVEPRLQWAQTQYGGKTALYAASNIVFSNGDFDPWSGFGVLDNISPSVVSILVKGGAHHLDLMFSHPLDPVSVLRCREIQKKHMKKWIAQVKYIS